MNSDVRHHQDEIANFQFVEPGFGSAHQSPAIESAIRESRSQFAALVEKRAFRGGSRNASEQFVDRTDGGDRILQVLVILMPDML
jgi:hypothetical protein